MNQLSQIASLHVLSSDTLMNVPGIFSGLGVTRCADGRMPSTMRRERRRSRNNRH
ncbi:hypothetical protein [Kordiimonas aquimaris]|uniref:hypothetical protein n=1 Tax=Kordiimonas aquimaris TaxID=707591 RepID=UPI0021D1DAF8|nr:hypothetical protein [Kordiimonas aquimaris]